MISTSAKKSLRPFCLCTVSRQVPFNFYILSKVYSSDGKKNCTKVPTSLTFPSNLSRAANLSRVANSRFAPPTRTATSMQLNTVAPRINPRLGVRPYVTAFHIVCRLQDVREAVERICRVDHEKSRISVREIRDFNRNSFP